jgi:hypothetical protein
VACMHFIAAMEPAANPCGRCDMRCGRAVHCNAGLFRTVTPQCKTADALEAPEFVARWAPGTSAADGSGSGCNGSGAGGGVVMQTVPPLGCIRFRVAQRALPPLKEVAYRLDSSLKVGGSLPVSNQKSPTCVKLVRVATTHIHIQHPLTICCAAMTQAWDTQQLQERLQTICADTLASTAPPKRGADGTSSTTTPSELPTLTALLRARRTIAAAFALPAPDAAAGSGEQLQQHQQEQQQAPAPAVVVSFLGVESGKVEILVRAAQPDDPPYTSGAVRGRTNLSAPLPKSPALCVHQSLSGAIVKRHARCEVRQRQQRSSGALLCHPCMPAAVID